MNCHIRNFSFPVFRTWQALKLCQKNIKTLAQTAVDYEPHWLQKSSLKTPVFLHTPSSVLSKKSWRTMLLFSPYFLFALTGVVSDVGDLSGQDKFPMCLTEL